jgi:very-short-patch-repair endonuclease
VDNISKLENIKTQKKITCFNNYGVDIISQHKDFKKNLNNIILKKLQKKYINLIDIVGDNFVFYCKKCDKNFEINKKVFYTRYTLQIELCTNCQPIGSTHISGLEKNLYSFINNNYNNEIIQSCRNIINPYEIDIYLPKLKIAFEFNGLFWHNENNIHKKYHLNKTELCEQQGIQLIHIYEDDWIYKQDIVKSMILNKLDKTKNKIFARKCEIKEITDNKLIRSFLDENHIQGFVGSKIKIGLFYNNELISLMTFGNKRISMGEKLTNNGEYELLRFCNKLNTNVVGGASKLFKYFIKTYKPTEITTYADRSFSQGKLYETLEFDFVSKTEPNYYYIVNGFRKYRFNYRKDILIKEGFDPNKTEHQIMLERKIYRIYDSGNLKYKKRLV